MDIKYKIMDDFNHIIEEKGNMFTALRKISWNDKDNYKLDLRKYYVTGDGETVGKGVSFMTEEGPNELAKVLVSEGYGYTDEILKELANREDFRASLNSVLNPDDKFYDENVKSEFFDPKELFSVEE